MLHIKTYKAECYPDLIERIWILENSEEDISIAVPPNQYINLIIPLEGSSYSYKHKILSQPQIEGLSLQSSYLHYPKGTKLIGIRFYPHGLHSFCKLSGREISNTSLNFNCASNAFEDFAANFKMKNPDELIRAITKKLSEIFDESNYQKAKLLRDYYQYFRGEHKMISIEEFCEQNKTNYSTLNRNFSKIIGISPKRFERLIKFRKALCSLIDSKEKLTSIGVDAGYFDQAHFIREFKLFLHNTPSTYQSILKSADQESQIINYNFRLF